MSLDDGQSFLGTMFKVPPEGNSFVIIDIKREGDKCPLFEKEGQETDIVFYLFGSSTGLYRLLMEPTSKELSFV